MGRQEGPESAVNKGDVWTAVQSPQGLPRGRGSHLPGTGQIWASFLNSATQEPTRPLQSYEQL